MVVILSDSGLLEDWQPSDVFANQKHREGVFAQSQEQAADPLIFQETPLVGLGENWEGIRERSRD